MLVPTSALLKDATAAGVGLAAFNVLHLETAEAIAAAAEETGLPVVLQLSQNCIRYHGALAPIAAACTAIAASADARIALHLDHAEDPALAFEAIDAGFGSVMIDAATLPYDHNVALTAAIVSAGRASGVLVEAELGEIGGKDGAHAPHVRTDPDEARAFHAATGVDALAVAVGSSHAMLERTAALDLGLIARLHAAVPVPLVLHGSSGVPDAAIRAAIAAGMTKINVSTQLAKAFTHGVRDALADATIVDSRKYLGAGRRALTAEAARLLAVIAGTP